MGAARDFARKIYAPILGPYVQRYRRAATTEDYNAREKMERSVDRIPEFGAADFADLATWIFASSLTNHRVIHQRIDEGSLLWRAVKMSGGPILELGRAAGGSTLVLLGASGSRPIVSIDRAPAHAFIAQRVFDRPDVSRRLKLYRQSTREPIAEAGFGLMFVDCDHSYDGVCHDIATFWNKLQSFDGRPPIAAFHDAADNPISFVEPVRRACLELLEEPGAARVLENWGSMLVLEKLRNIDSERWYGREDHKFWKRYSDENFVQLPPRITVRSVSDSTAPFTLRDVNLLGEENVEGPTWVKAGIEVEAVEGFGADNPIRLVRSSSGTRPRYIAKTVRVGCRSLCFSVFLRPYRLRTVRLSIHEAQRDEIGRIDFDFDGQPRVRDTAARTGAVIAHAGYRYRNGYFLCDLAMHLAAPVSEATFAIELPNDGGASRLLQKGKNGFFINLSSVREIL